MKKILSLFIFFSTLAIAYPQQAQMEWQQCYGGSDQDNGRSVVVLENGNIVVFGGTNSNDFDVSSNHGGYDFWLFETDSTGNLLWEKTYGGSDDDLPERMMQSPDGGYVLFGSTVSNDGDVSGNHGNVDYWVVKTDSVGNLLWQRCLGSHANDIPSDMDIDGEGNIYVMGLTVGHDGDVSANNGFYDYWFLKLDPNGQIVWDKNLGGTYTDNGLCISATSDGGVIVGGLIDDIDGDITCNTSLGQVTAWVVKLDSANNIEWQQCYGGTYTESVVDIKNTADGGYIFLGLTNSNDGDVSGYHGTPGNIYNFDIWVIKVDSIGSIEWQRCLGGYENESPEFIKITPEGNYLVGGNTVSNDGDVSGNHSITGRSDQWIVKLDQNGMILWQQCFGGSWDDGLFGSCVLSETKYLMIGSSSYSGGGDVDCDLKGEGDVWMYKLFDTTVGVNEPALDSEGVKVYPNPAFNYVLFEINNTNHGSRFTEIILKNIYGQIVKTIPIVFNQASTNNKFVWDTRSVQQGVYIYTLKGTGCNKSGKIIICK